MATSKEFHDYVMDRLSKVGDFWSLRMMGEYCIGMDDKVIGLLCDDMLLLKPTESVLKLMPDAERRYPYEGSKTLMVIVEDIENTALLAEMTSAMYGELPRPKEKKTRKRPSGNAPRIRPPTDRARRGMSDMAKRKTSAERPRHGETPDAEKGVEIVKLSERRDLKDIAAAWFADKWKIPAETYSESIEASFSSVVPSWYLCLENGKPIAGMGVVENDFHDRRDLSPNVCAVYTEPERRGRGIAGKLLSRVCADMAAHGIRTLYLITDHVGFYERYGWKFHCMAQGDGDPAPSRIYMRETPDP